jgi:hypothetical protein
MLHERPNPLALSPKTVARLDEEMHATRLIVQAALLDLGAITHERDDFRLRHLVREEPSAEQPVTYTDYHGEPAAWMGALHSVERAYACVFGRKEQLAEFVRRKADTTARIAELLTNFPRIHVPRVETHEIDVFDSELALIGVTDDVAQSLLNLCGRDVAPGLARA